MKSIALVIRPALACLIVFASLLTGNAEAVVVLHTDDNGKLVGASGVRVDGRTLNVRFFDGNCWDLFSGCLDTPFMAPQAAAHASDALLRHVLIDAAGQSFDSNPALTFGCNDSAVCFIVTYESRYMSSYAAVNVSGSARDWVMPTEFTTAPNYNFWLDDKATVGFWEDVTIPMPEPSSTALLCLSLLALGWTQRRGRSRKVHPKRAFRAQYSFVGFSKRKGRIGPARAELDAADPRDPWLQVVANCATWTLAESVESVRCATRAGITSVTDAACVGGTVRANPCSTTTCTFGCQ